MDTNPPALPSETDAAENEAVTEERKMKSWSKPVIRPLGQTVYTATGATVRPNQVYEDFSYHPTTS